MDDYDEVASTPPMAGPESTTLVGQLQAPEGDQTQATVPVADGDDDDMTDAEEEPEGGHPSDLIGPVVGPKAAGQSDGPESERTTLGGSEPACTPAGAIGARFACFARLAHMLGCEKIRSKYGKNTVIYAVFYCILTYFNIFSTLLFATQRICQP